MKHSIKKIFQNLNTYLFFIIIVSFVAVLFIIEQNVSYEKVNILNKQKTIIHTLTKLKQDDYEIALIQFNGKSTQLFHEIDKLRNLYKYDYSDQYVFHNSDDYLKDLDILQTLTTRFNKTAHKFYTADKKIQITQLQNDFHVIDDHINDMLLKCIHYNQEKFQFIEKLTFIVFLITISTSLWYRKRLNHIYKDLEYLFLIDKKNIDYKIYSIEADAIAMRMNRKSVATNNPSMLDPVTGINNYKGMLSSYGDKKNLKDSNFTAVAVLEIDNAFMSKSIISQEYAQVILKKIAYTLSLHEQAVDVIARTNYNQFTLIFSRASKEQAYKDINLARQSIEELKFSVPNQGQVTITLSGGFIIKPNNTNLEEALKQTKEILTYAKETGINRLLQSRDLAQREM